jgi:hypothetical protein
MRKLILELLLSAAFVFVPTVIIYGHLVGIPSFWSSQFLWNVALAVGWTIVSAGYFHQGMLVRERGDASEVSIVLPSAVFVVQCILFVKGVFYRDWALIGGALIVNSGVVFSLYQIAKANGFFKKNILSK